MGESNNSPIAKLVAEVNLQLLQLYVKYTKSVTYLGNLLGDVYGMKVYFENPEFLGNENTILGFYSTIKEVKEELTKIREEQEEVIAELDRIMRSVKDVIKVEDVGKVFPIYTAIKDTAKIFINMIDEAISIADSVNNLDEVKKRVIRIEELQTMQEIKAYSLGLRLLSTIYTIRKFQKIIETVYYSFLSASSLGKDVVKEVITGYIKQLKSDLDYLKEVEKDINEINDMLDAFLIEIKGSKYEVLLRELREKYKRSFEALMKSVSSYLQEVNKVGYDVGVVKN